MIIEQRNGERKVMSPIIEIEYNGNWESIYHRDLDIMKIYISKSSKLEIIFDKKNDKSNLELIWEKYED